MARLFDLLGDSGVPLQKVDAFLDADPDGHGSVRDQIAADVSNQLLAAFGQRARHSVRDVRRLRARGAWKSFDQPPSDEGPGGKCVLTGGETRTKLKR